MLEKYLKIIEKSRSQKDIVQNFLEKDIGLSDFSFDIVGDRIKIESSSQDRFLLKIKDQDLREFLKENKLRSK